MSAGGEWSELFCEGARSGWWHSPMTLNTVCRHLKIAGRIAFCMISSGYQPAASNVATQPSRQQSGLLFHFPQQ